MNNKSIWFKSSLLFLLWFCVFIPVYPVLWQTWMNSSNNSHGLLVPLISVFLIWTKRDQLSKANLDSSNWGVVILIVSLALYIVSLAGHVAVIQRAMIVFSLIGLILFNFGPLVFNISAFPLFYLIFMIPVPVSVYTLVAFPLQLFATNVAYVLIKVVNIPVFKEGNMLYFVQTQLEVAEACSGLRSMMAFVMLSVLFAYFMDRGWWRRGALILSSIPLAIAVNIVRVTGTGVLAHFYGEKVARGFMHEFSGLVVFALGFVLMFLEFVLLNKTRR